MVTQFFTEYALQYNPLNKSKLNDSIGAHCSRILNENTIFHSNSFGNLKKVNYDYKITINDVMKIIFIV